MAAYDNKKYHILTTALGDPDDNKYLGEVALAKADAEVTVLFQPSDKDDNLWVWTTDTDSNGSTNSMTFYEDKNEIIDYQGSHFTYRSDGQDPISSIDHSHTDDPKYYKFNMISPRDPYGYPGSKTSSTVYDYSYNDSTLDQQIRDDGFLQKNWDWRVSIYARRHIFLIHNMIKDVATDDNNIYINLNRTEYSNRSSTGKGLPPLSWHLDPDGYSYARSGSQYVIALKDNETKLYRLRTQYNKSESNMDGNSKRKLEITADFFDDSLDVFRYKLKTPTNLSRPGKGRILSWGKVDNATSYTIYKNGDLTNGKTITGTSYQIPKEDYYGVVNSWTIKANTSFTKSTIHERYMARFNSGLNDLIRARPVTTLNVYSESSIASSTAWNNIGELYAPTFSITKNALNKFTINVSADKRNQLQTLKYSITGGLIQSGDIPSNNQLVLDNLKVGITYDISIWARHSGVNSPIISDDITPVKAPLPIFTNPTQWMRLTANTYEIKFTSSKNDGYSTGNTPDRFDVYFLEGDRTYTNAISPINITGLHCNSNNTIKITSVFEADTSYNSEATYTIEANRVQKLATPTLTKEDISDMSVREFYGDTGNTSINDKRIITRMKLSWPKIQFADGYVLYDEYSFWDPDNEDWAYDERTLVSWPSQSDETEYTDFMDTLEQIIPAPESPGYHRYYVKAVFKDDELYNSSVSETIEVEQGKILEDPTVIYHPGTTTLTFDKVPFADFYSIQLTPTLGTASNLFRSVLLDSETDSLTYNFYDMVKDLDATETFNITVIARSYNAFHYPPSNPSNVAGSIDVIKLKTPTFRSFEPDEGSEEDKDQWMSSDGTVAWSGDNDAYKYDIYLKDIAEGEWSLYNTPIKTEDTPSPWEYQFTGIGGGFYNFYVIARRNDSATNSAPVYLDSDPSETKGAGRLLQPNNFQRIENVFSWDDVGDNVQRYIFYDNGNVVAVNFGGGITMTLGKEEGDEFRPSPGHHVYQVQAASEIGGETYYSTLVSWDKIAEGTTTETEKLHYIECDIVHLNQLTAYYLNETESHIKWDELDPNVVYDTRVNNISEKDLTNENLYSITKDAPGLYYFKVRSVSTGDKFLFQTSLWSEDLLYPVYQLARPEISLKIDDLPDSATNGLYTLSWAEVPEALDYRVHINFQDNETKETQHFERLSNGLPTYSFYPFGEYGDGNFSIYVIALGSTDVYERPRYVDSANSNILNFGVLEPPHISITDNMISWEHIYLADFYRIYNGVQEFSQTDDNFFELDVSKPGSYSIRVSAVSTQDNVKPSELSNTISYVVRQLDVPKNVVLTENKLSWDPVIDAEKYSIWVNDSEVVQTAKTSYDMTEVFNEAAGIIRIYVKATSSRINLLESNESNYVLKSIIKNKKYNLVIDGVNYDEVQLPFKISQTLDDTLDTASLTLAYLKRKEPFEKLTPAKLIVYESEMASRTYSMIVESDEVQSVQVGRELRYKHIINLIENTLILQNEIVPDFSVTKPVAQQLLSKATVDPDLGGNIIPGRDWGDTDDYVETAEYFEFDWALFPKFVQNVLKKLNIEGSIIDGAVNFLEELLLKIPEDLRSRTFGKLNFMGLGEAIGGKLKEHYTRGMTIGLPMPTGRLTGYAYNLNPASALFDDLFETNAFSKPGGALGYWIQDAADWVDSRWGVFGDVLSTGMDWVGKGVVYVSNPFESLTDLMGDKLGVDGITIMDDDWAYPARKYYIRPHEEGYGKSKNEKEIASIGPSSTLKNLTYTFDKPGKYDIILEIPPVNFKELAEKHLVDIDPLLGISSELSGHAAIVKLVGTFIHWIISFFGVDIDFSSFFDKNNLEYEEFWNKITGIKWPESVNYMKGSDENTKPYRIVWHNIEVLDKPIEDEPKSISWVLNKVCSLVNNKYSIDPAVSKITESYPCPDLTFSGMKTLYEVLATLGKEFYGLPRLLDNNVITFDILDETSPAAIHQKIWRDQDVLSVRKQELDKTATGYVSPISHMVPDDDYTIFPGPGMWTVAKGDGSGSIITVPNTAIVLDRPIYKIEYVKVKNVLKNSPDLVLDITDYVYQDVVYDALSSAEFGKGTALSWSQEKNMIEGLGQIPHESKLYAALGWSEDEYVIEHIVKDFLGEVPEMYTADKYLYQVKYRPYVDVTAYTENSNKTDQRFTMYKVFNQSDNVISDARFGDSALLQLKRHGNDTIEKSYITDSIIGVPMLGDSSTIDDDVYYIDEITYEFKNQYISSHVRFSKNHNKINPRVSVDSTYRQYELRSDANVNRNLNFNDYCYVGDRDERRNIVDYTYWRYALYGCFNNDVITKPDTFYFNCYNNSKLDKISYLSTDNEGALITETIEGIALPATLSKLGSSLLFSAQMQDSFSAGPSVRKMTYKKKDTRLVQDYVRYVGDNSGDQCPYMRITIGTLPNSLKTTDAQMEYPSVKWLSQPNISLTNPYFSKQVRLFKDQRERLGFDYQMHFISNRHDLFIHKGLTKYLFKNYYNSDEFVPDRPKPILVAYNGNISNKDTLSFYTKIGDVKTTTKSTYTFSFSNLSSDTKATRNYDGLAIIWPDTKEIILEIRQPIKKGETFKYTNKLGGDDIYFNFSNKLLK